MAKYRKKPVVIEAFQWSYGMGHENYPKWAQDAFDSGDETLSVGIDDSKMKLYIKTLEGVMAGDEGDFIIQGIKGEIYPCKPDIFEATYERVVIDVPDFKCDQCKGTTKHSYCCENPSCPNMPCCGKSVEDCTCSYEPIKHEFKVKEFKKAYANALADKKEIFIFGGEEYLVGYAKYLIEYFNNLANDKKSKTSQGN